MLGLLLVAVGTAAAMLLLVAFAGVLFRENRTRELRRPAAAQGRSPAAEPAPEPVVWRTVVDPETLDAGAVRPFAVAYARAMTVSDAGAELPGHRAA